ncbi:hypothetical protein DFQ29_007787 [Apophysomyces sp. BC1021]|nr:hypothetical protein DFQ29_007787 [Apophysomyces sp. BC1021]
MPSQVQKEESRSIGEAPVTDLGHGIVVDSIPGAGVHRVRRKWPILWARLCGAIGDGRLISGSIVGEPLKAISQLRALSTYIDYRHQYKADGVVRSAELHELEVLLLETSRHFKSNDNDKVACDHYKGIWYIGYAQDYRRYLSLGIHVHIPKATHLPRVCCTRLWSISYTKNGVYLYRRELKVEFHRDFDRKTDYLLDTVDHFWKMRALLADTIKVLVMLQMEHKAQTKADRYKAHPTTVPLPDIINPTILKLSYPGDAKGLTGECSKSFPKFYDDDSNMSDDNDNIDTVSS